MDQPDGQPGCDHGVLDRTLALRRLAAQPWPLGRDFFCDERLCNCDLVELGVAQMATRNRFSPTNRKQSRRLVYPERHGSTAGANGLAVRVAIRFERPGPGYYNALDPGSGGGLGSDTVCRYWAKLDR